MSRSRKLWKLMLFWTAMVAMGIAIVPAAFELGARAERVWFPVTTTIAVHSEQRVSDGVSFYVEFTKTRACEFQGLVWYDGAQRLVLDFEPDADQSPETRPIGDQITGPWLLHGVASLEGTRAVAFHQCHPLWQSVTDLYP